MVLSPGPVGRGRSVGATAAFTAAADEEDTMSKQIEFGCKKCGTVVHVEVQPWSERVEVNTKDGKIHDSFGKIELQCKKCSKAVAVLSLAPV